MSILHLRLGWSVALILGAPDSIGFNWLDGVTDGGFPAAVFYLLDCCEYVTSMTILPHIAQRPFLYAQAWQYFAPGRATFVLHVRHLPIKESWTILVEEEEEEEDLFEA